MQSSVVGRGLLLGVIATTTPVCAQEVLWRIEAMTAEIKRDDQYLRVGQYLHLTQKLRPNEKGWTMMKIDIPEHWNVRAISLANGRVRIDTAAHSAYELTRDNVGKLSFEILDNGQKTDDELGKRHVNRR